MINSIIGKSEAVRSTRDLIKKVAPSDSTVLILGESGTGKELVAQALHSCSERAESTFIPVNCGAIPADLMESELFGHKKGAFTGAFSDRKGRFELANNGTIFLDEIGDMPLNLQVKLLRVLQERVIDPVGSSRQLEINVRVIAATHQNISEKIKSNEFREDLYYRLNVIPIEIPPLRERKEDIVPLLSHFAIRAAKDRTTPIKFSENSLKILSSYYWPGNIRELANLVDRFTTLHPGEMIELAQMLPSMIPIGLRSEIKEVSDLSYKEEALSTPNEPESDTNSSNKGDAVNYVEDAIMMAQGWDTIPDEGFALKVKLGEIEKKFIENALQKSNGNVSKTARLLNMQRTTLIEKINKYKIKN